MYWSFMFYWFSESRVYYFQNAWEFIDVQNIDEYGGVKNMAGFDKYLYQVGKWFMHVLLKTMLVIKYI